MLAFKSTCAIALGLFYLLAYFHVDSVDGIVCLVQCECDLIRLINCTGRYASVYVILKHTFTYVYKHIV